MSNNENHLKTNVADLFAPANRFASASRMLGRMHRWWLLLRRYWWPLALILLAVLGSTCLLTSLSGPVYQSKARLWLTGKFNFSEDQLYTEQLIDFLGTQAALLRSPTIQNRAMARLR